jgi:hypothetical protein
MGEGNALLLLFVLLQARLVTTFEENIPTKQLVDEANVAGAAAASGSAWGVPMVLVDDDTGSADIISKRRESDAAFVSMGDAEWCTTMQNKHSVDIGSSWGTLIVRDRSRWTVKDCNSHLQGESAQMGPKYDWSKEDKLEWCRFLVKKYGVTVQNEGFGGGGEGGQGGGEEEEGGEGGTGGGEGGVGGASRWGSLPPGKRKQWWTAGDCDVMKAAAQKKAAEKRYIQTSYRAHTLGAALARPAHERIRSLAAGVTGGGVAATAATLTTSTSTSTTTTTTLPPPPPPPPNAIPVIAIGVATTSKGVEDPEEFEDLALCQYLLPSLARTAEVGFEYRVYVAYDAGDSFWDNRARQVRGRIE